MNPHSPAVPDWVNWIAQDADGAWWGYQVEPLQNHHGWYENEVGRSVRLSRGDPNLHWRDSLEKIGSPQMNANKCK